VVKRDIKTDAIVGISCAILIVLFFAQPLGISKLGTIFDLVVIV
jgi:KUP system potassium uptake protein